MEINAASSMGNSETVLVTEDECSILRMSKMMLERLGYKVLAANSPDEAIRLARDHDGEIPSIDNRCGDARNERPRPLRTDPGYQTGDKMPLHVRLHG